MSGCAGRVRRRSTGRAARRGVLALRLLAALFLACPAAAGAASESRGPAWTRGQMEADRPARERPLLVYGTLDPAATAVLRQRAQALARGMFGGDSSAVRADRDVPETELTRGTVLLLGGPGENQWTRRLAPRLPVQFGDRRFTWHGTSYVREGEAIHLVYPNPLAPKRFLLLVAANSIGAYARRVGMMFGEEDWRITRDGEVLRSGRFAQDPKSPWSYAPALDRDREAERTRWFAGLGTFGRGRLRVHASPGTTLAAALVAAGDAVLARLDAAGLGPPVRPGPAGSGAAVDLFLYPSLERKGVLTRDTRPEHLDEAGRAHVARGAGGPALDLWSVAAARLVRTGASRDSRFLVPAAVGFAGRWQGEPLEQSLGRLYFGRMLPVAEQAATRSPDWRSSLVWVPARALLVRAIGDAAPGGARRPATLALLRDDPPGTLDSLCVRAGVPRARVEARYRALADSLARAGRPALASGTPKPWRPADGFTRGVCLAHAVSLEGGYLSEACGRELATLREAGAGAVALTPFGYLPDAHTPEIFPSAEGGPDEETDEAVCEAARRAHVLGLQVWLAPHLWTRGWVGDLAFTTADWPRFFDRYHEFAMHWAILAQRERLDGLMVGHELASATARDPDRWRALIADVRAVYTGTVSYEANWDEVLRVPFWDALDLISVSFYSPLTATPTRDPGRLAAGATRALSALQPLAKRVGRPVLLAEAGYAAVASAPVRPWEEGRGSADPETQRACYRALLEALRPCDWVAGVFWWKWASSAGDEGRSEASFSPRGRPAEAVLRESLREWQGRPVRVPR